MEGPPPHPVRRAQPTLTDGACWLTPWRPGDAALVGDLNLDPDHARWFDQPIASTDARERLEHGREVIANWWAGWTDGTILAFALRTCVDGKAIGALDLRPRPPIAASIAYTVIPGERGRGVAARAARLLAEAGLVRFGFRRIELMCDVANVPSQRVAEAAGFTFEGIGRGVGWYEHAPDLSGRTHDARVYSMIERDLEA